MFGRIMITIAACIISLALSMPALAGPASDKDFKAASDAMDAMAKACKANDKEKVKTFLSKAARADIEKDPSMLDFFMAFCSEFGIGKNSKATVEGNKMIIVKTTKDESGTRTETTYMVKEDGKWKFGKE